MTDTSELVYPYQDIFQEAAEKGIDADRVQKLLDKWEKKYIGSPDSLDDLIDGVPE